MNTFKITPSELIDETTDILSRVYYKDHSFIVHRDGEPRAAIVSIEDYQLVKDLRDRAEADLIRRRKENHESE